LKASPTRFPASSSAAIFGGRKFNGRVRNFPYRRHHLIRRRLLDHVAISGNSVKPALRNVGMEPRRLSFDVNQPVLLTCNDDDRHLQIRVSIAEFESVWNHQRRFRRGCFYLGSRSAISFGNASNFFGTDRAPKILRIISGQIARLIRADKVWLRMSPTSGKAGVPIATTSGTPPSRGRGSKPCEAIIETFFG
jgi:hypothetical protein